MDGRKINVITIALLLLVAALISCRPAKVATQQPAEKTAFYTIGLSRDTVKRQTKAQVKNVTVTDVKINYRPDDNKAREPNFLRISIIYKNGKTVDALAEHPLYKRFDLYSESGQIESKLISLQQGDVVVRVPYFESYKRISITEVVNFKESAPIILKNEK